MEVVGVPAAAIELNISQNRVRQLIYSGKLPAQQLGREWVITRQNLDRFKAIPRPEGRPKKLTITVNPATAAVLTAARPGADDEGDGLPY